MRAPLALTLSLSALLLSLPVRADYDMVDLEIEPDAMEMLEPEPMPALPETALEPETEPIPLPEIDPKPELPIEPPGPQPELPIEPPIVTVPPIDSRPPVIVLPPPVWWLDTPWDYWHPYDYPRYHRRQALLQLEVREAVKIRVIDSEQRTLLDETLADGEVRSLRGRAPFAVTLADRSVIELYFNGQRVSLDEYPIGDPIYFQLPPNR